MRRNKIVERLLQGERKVLSLADYNKRQATANETVTNGGKDVIAITENAPMALTESTARCRICQVAVFLDSLTDHEMDHLESNLIERVKEMAVKEKSNFLISGSLRCGVCGVRSSKPSEDEQWREIARHIGQSHGLLEDLLSFKNGFDCPPTLSENSKQVQISSEPARCSTNGSKRRINDDSNKNGGGADSAKKPRLDSSKKQVKNTFETVLIGTKIFCKIYYYYLLAFVLVLCHNHY